jgi:hypothetical protein
MQWPEPRRARRVNTRMQPWKQASRQALVTGAVASAVSAAALALCGWVENRRAAGPINGPSQWVYGRWAARMRGPSLRHTLVGYAIHHLTATGWALLHERVFGGQKSAQSRGARLRRAAVTAATANFVDYQLTPKRLQPGFEAQLSRKALFVVYAAFALGLAISNQVAQPRRTRPESNARHEGEHARTFADRPS